MQRGFNGGAILGFDLKDIGEGGAAIRRGEELAQHIEARALLRGVRHSRLMCLGRGAYLRRDLAQLGLLCGQRVAERMDVAA